MHHAWRWQVLGAALVLAALATVGPTLRAEAGGRAQDASSGKRDAPRLAADEFERLYERMTGIWARRPDKSTYTRNPPNDRLYVIYEADGERAIKYTNRLFDADGQETTTSSRQVLDGRDYPATPSGDLSIARLPLDEFTVETTARRAGRLTGRNTQFFSADGQRMSILVRSIDADGERLVQVSVFDKVARVGE